MAFGIGAPALFITQAHLTEPLIKSGQAVCIAILFLGGMAIQIGIAALNKWINWYLYYGEENPELKEGSFYKRVDKVSRWFWLDVSADILSIVLFAWGTIKVLSVLANTPSDT